MKSLILRVIRQMKGDRRTLALLLFAPLLVLTLIYLLLGNPDYRPSIAVRELPHNLVLSLERQDADIISFPSGEDVVQYLKDGEADAVLWMDTKGLHLQMLESSSKTAIVSTVVKNAAVALNPSSGLSVAFVFGTDTDNNFNALGYVFLGILSFFFVFVISGMALVKERSSQTLERMLMTPVRRWEVVAGYTLGYGVFAAIQSILVVAYTRYVLGLDCAGSLLLVMLVMVLLAFTAVSMGALASIFANSEFQVMQFIPIVLVPQIFFSGLIPLDTMPWGLGNLGYATPVYYGCTALHKIMKQGAGIIEIWPWLAGLLAYMTLLSVLNILALKKYRKL